MSKSFDGAVLPLVEHDRLNCSHDDTQRDKGLSFTVSV